MSLNPAVAEAPWKATARGVRANVAAGLVLQVAALALVLAYYNHPGTRAWLSRLSQFRTETGVGFAIFSTGLVGGLIPLLYLKSRAVTRGRYSWKQGAGVV